MTQYLDFLPPAALRTRGTVLVVPGRGETRTTYQRFGSRIAADSYRVRVLPERPPADSLDAAVLPLAADLAAALSGLDAETPRPLVLVGADTAAVSLAALVSQGATDAVWWPDGLVLAGLPGYGGYESDGGWESELDVRSHCPVHRGVLSDDSALHRGSLATPPAGELLDAAYNSTADVPQLLLVGDADPLADREAISRAVKGLPAARLSVVRDAHHDVLNDQQHRAVAAEVVAFLETLRAGRPLQPIVAAASSTW